jgi:hypothetical protein
MSSFVFAFITSAEGGEGVRGRGNNLYIDLKSLPEKELQYYRTAPSPFIYRPFIVVLKLHSIASHGFFTVGRTGPTTMKVLIDNPHRL